MHEVLGGSRGRTSPCGRRLCPRPNAASAEGQELVQVTVWAIAEDHAQGVDLRHHTQLEPDDVGVLQPPKQSLMPELLPEADPPLCPSAS